MLRLFGHAAAKATEACPRSRSLVPRLQLTIFWGAVELWLFLLIDNVLGRCRVMAFPLPWPRRVSKREVARAPSPQVNAATLFTMAGAAALSTACIAGDGWKMHERCRQRDGIRHVDIEQSEGSESRALKVFYAERQEEAKTHIPIVSRTKVCYVLHVKKEIPLLLINSLPRTQAYAAYCILDI